MIEEIGLIALAIYLLRKGTPDYMLLPPGKELYDLIQIANGQQGVPQAPDHLVCPWLWKKRPAIFNVVPINPKSRNNWRTLCRIWMEIRLLGLEIKRDKAFLPAKSKEEDVSQLEQKIKNAKNRQAFLLNETKRLADIQKRTEALYVRSLKNTFSEDEIKDFYLKRKKEIEQGIWPNQDTQVVPIVSPGGGRDQTDIDVGPIDPGTGVVQMGGQKEKERGVFDHERLFMPDGRKFNTKDLHRDRMRGAKLPGKRISKDGNVYYEWRSNRSDEFGPKADYAKRW